MNMSCFIESYSTVVIFTQTMDQACRQDIGEEKFVKNIVSNLLGKQSFGGRRRKRWTLEDGYLDWTCIEMACYCIYRCLEVRKPVYFPPFHIIVGDYLLEAYMTGGAPQLRDSLIRGPQSLLAKLLPDLIRMEYTAFCQKTEIQSEKHPLKFQILLGVVPPEPACLFCREVYGDLIYTTVLCRFHCTLYSLMQRR